MPTLVIRDDYDNKRMAVYGPMKFIVNSVESGNQDFRYVANIFVALEGNDGLVNAATYQNVSSGGLLIVPNPSGDGEFDIHRILENYVGGISMAGANGIVGTGYNGFGTKWTSQYVFYKIEFGVQYRVNPTDADVTSFLNLESFEGIAWNGAMQYDTYGIQNADSILEMNSVYSRFLDDIPATGVSVTMDSFYQLFAHSYGITGLDSIAVETYTADGTLIHTNTLSNGSLGSPLTAFQPGYNMVSFGVGPGQIGGWTPTTGTVPIITDNTDYYLVYLIDGTSAQISEKKRFNINRCCNEGEIVLTWLNRHGGWDTFTFTGKSQHTVPVKRSVYDRILGSSYGTGFKWNNGDRGRTVLSVRAQDRFKITTGLITESELNWLENLTTSSSVFLVDNALAKTNFYNSEVFLLPYIVTSNLHDNKFVKPGNRLRDYTIEIEAAFDKNIQRG